MMLDGMVQELKGVSYVPQLKRNLISVGAFEELGLEVSIRDGILKMTRGSIVVLNGVRCNNFYYLKGSTVTGQVTTSTNSDDDFTQLLHIRLGHTRKVFANSCKARFIKRCQNLQIEFLLTLRDRKEDQGDIQHRDSVHRGILDYVHTYIGGPIETVSIGSNHYFVSL